MSACFISYDARIDLLLCGIVITVDDHQRDVLTVFARMARFGTLANKSVLVVTVIEIETLTKSFVLV